jgi:16S rRNA (guanine527-N7)-methyltransferase
VSDRFLPLAPQLAALAPEMGVTLDASQCEKLEQFARLMLSWNRVHNLTAITAPDGVLTHHLLDSLSIATALQQTAQQIDDAHAAQEPPKRAPVRVLDVGAGAGLPGIPLAVALPALQFTLIDAVAKKTAFMTQAKLELALTNVHVQHCRAEQMHGGAYDIVVSRALGTLADFTTLTRHLLAPGGRWLAMKGADPLQEVSDLPPGVHALQTVKLRVPRLDEERHLVVLAAAGTGESGSPGGS